MKITQLNNAIEVSDIDLHNDEDCQELGKLVAEECVVFVNDSVTEDRLFDIQSQWGDMSTPPVLKYVAEEKPNAEHWEFLNKTGRNITESMDKRRHGISRVSFDKNEKGEPTGIFTNGKLFWHCDQQAVYESQRVIGLMSLYSTKNSQTTFLRTADAYDKLNQDDKTMVDELVTVSNWDEGISEDLDEGQMNSAHYHMCPADGLEQPLKNTTATGLQGIKFPSHSFSHFKGMSKKDSLKFREHIWGLLNRPEYIYAHNWEDGQIMFMDQNITIHARPTDVTEGNRRTLTRCVSYVNKLFDNQDPLDYILFEGRKIPKREFVEMVDEKRLRDFNSGIKW